MKTKLILGSFLLFSSVPIMQSQSASYDSNPLGLSGFDNTALGGQAMQMQLFGGGTGTGNSGIGNASLWSNNSGNNNSGSGAYSLFKNTSGTDNTATGYMSMYNNDGSFNVATGSGALFNNTAGNGNSAHGYFALYTNVDGRYNVANGYGALQSNNVGSENVSSGFQALYLNSGGNHNVASGSQALFNNDADDNVATGYKALYNNISGTYNVAAGTEAMYTDKSGVLCVAIGNQALYSSNGNHHTSAIGHQALYSTTTGYDNTAVGEKALYYSVSGNFNTAIGANAGNIAVFAPRHSNTLLGSWTGFTASGFDNSTAVGANAVVNASNRVWLGHTGATVWTTISYNLSDGRFKNNIKEDEVKGLEFIKLLRPVTYDLDCKKMAAHLTQNMPDSSRKRYMEQDFSAIAGRQSGFIAQEVEIAAKKSGYNFSGVYVPDKNNNTDTYGISYYQLVVPLVKAVQEQQQMIEQQKQRMDALEKINTDLMDKVGASTGINQVNSISGFSMDQNNPNPFTHETVIKYTLPQQINSAYGSV